VIGLNRVVGIWINRTKQGAESLGVEIIRWFKRHNWQVHTEWQEIITQKPDFIISLGGDGTLLEAAREAAPFDIPVLGVNLGRLGFLCELEKDDVFPALEQVIRGNYQLEKRLMLCGTFALGDETEVELHALNDIVLFRSNTGGMITLQVKVSGEELTRLPADGLIIATPTGSTAYSLSAGGPILAPNLKAILLTHLSAHTLSARPMVISHEEELEIRLIRGERCQLSFDGVKNYILPEGVPLRVRTAPISALLIRLGTRSYASVLREKLSDRWHD